MSPGRASAALTKCRPLPPDLAFWTQVATPAQPLPGILCPACSSDQVTNEAHHGFPGSPPPAFRYSSTFAPVFELPISCTPSWLLAMFSAAPPSGLPSPAVSGAEAFSTTAPATPACPRAAACARRGGSRDAAPRHARLHGRRRGLRH